MLRMHRYGCVSLTEQMTVGAARTRPNRRAQGSVHTCTRTELGHSPGSPIPWQDPTLPGSVNPNRDGRVMLARSMMRPGRIGIGFGQGVSSRVSAEGVERSANLRTDHRDQPLELLTDIVLALGTRLVPS